MALHIDRTSTGFCKKGPLFENSRLILPRSLSLPISWQGTIDTQLSILFLPYPVYEMGVYRFYHLKALLGFQVKGRAKLRVFYKAIA